MQRTDCAVSSSGPEGQYETDLPNEHRRTRVEVLAADGHNNQVHFKTPPCGGGEKVSKFKQNERDAAVHPTGDLGRDRFYPAIDRRVYQATEYDRIDSETVHKALTAQDSVRQTALMQLKLEYAKLQEVSSSVQVEFVVKYVLFTAFVEPWCRKAQLFIESCVSDWCEDGT